MTLKHLKSFDKLNENLDHTDIIDYKGDMKSMLDELIGFDPNFIQLSYAEFFILYKTDFSAFKEFIRYCEQLFNRHHTESHISTESKETLNAMLRQTAFSFRSFNTRDNADSYIYKLWMRLLKTGESEKFMEYTYFINSLSLTGYTLSKDDIGDYLSAENIVKLIKLRTIENSDKLVTQMLNDGDTDAFIDIATHIAKANANQTTRSFGTSFNLKYSEISDKLTDEQLLQLHDTGLITIPALDLVRIQQTKVITANDVIANEDNMLHWLFNIWQEAPANLVFDLTLVKNLFKLDFEIFLKFLAVTINLSEDIHSYEIDLNPSTDYNARTQYRDSIEGTLRAYAKNSIDAVIAPIESRLKMKKTKYQGYQAGTIGAHLTRIIQTLAKANRFNDIIRIATIISPKKLPLTVKPIETLFNKLEIKELLNINAINLGTADIKRLTEDHDQYAMYTNDPLYKTLIDVFNMSDSTTPLVKKNGNIRFNGNDEYSLHSYGEVRRVGISGITVKCDMKADTPEGVANMFKKFGEYLCRNAFAAMKRADEHSYYDNLKQYIKKNPIKSRSAELQNWIPWFNGLYEYISNYDSQGRHKNDIGMTFNYKFGAPKYSN